MSKAQITRHDFARLILLAAIWGASYLFNRIVAPSLGPVLTAELRTLIGGVALAAYFAAIGFDPEWRRWWRQYLLVAILSSALPFVLWAYAALSVSAGLLSVLNATSPMWGALCSALLLRERLNARRMVGLGIGVVGVAVLTQPGGGAELHYPSVAAALAASFLVRPDRYLYQGMGEQRALARASRGHAARRRHPAGAVSAAVAARRGTDAAGDRMHACARPGLRRCRVCALFPPDRRHRRHRGAHGDLPHPGVRPALGS